MKDSWMDVISSQGSSLLSVDLSSSEVTDSGLALLKDCSNLQALTYNYCDHVSERGLKHISGKISVFYLFYLGYFCTQPLFTVVVYNVLYFPINDMACFWRLQVI